MKKNFIFNSCSRLVMAAFILLLCQGMMSAQTFNGAGLPGDISNTLPATESVATSNLTGTIGTDFVLDQVAINLTHTFDGDLDIVLISPAGTSLDLSIGNGGSGDNYTNTIFQDGGADIVGGTAPFTGTFEAEGGTFAAAFAGESVEGLWTLSVDDGFGGDDGVLTQFDITFVEILCTIDACGPNVTLAQTALDATACGGFVNVVGPTTTGDCTDLITNDFTGTDDASGIYPVGTTTVTWTNGLGSTCTQTVTIVDDVAPVLAGCPDDTTIGLQPGDCTTNYNFLITATDNCPVSETPITFNGPCGDPNAIVLTTSALSCGAGPNTYFQFVDVAGPGTITGVTVGGPTTGGGTATVTVFDATGVTVPSTTLPILATGAGSTVGSAYAAIPASGSYGAGVTQVLVAITTPGAFVLSTVGCGNASASWISAPACGLGAPSAFEAIGFPELGVAFALEATQPIPLEATADTNAPDGYNVFASGDNLPIGVHFFQYQFTDNAGLQSTCDWSVTVNEFSGDISENLFCNANINIGVDDGCEVLICADNVLEGGPYGCYDNYNVTILNVPTNAVANNGTSCVTVKADQLPDWAENGMYGPFDVMVTDPNGNTCWNTGWMVEDKMAPTIECGDPIELSCEASTAPGTGVTGTISAASGAADASWDDGATGNVANVIAAVAGAPAGAIVTGVTVSLEMDHSWVSDLEVALVAPDGTSILIMDGECGANDNINATFDDAAAAAVCAATANNGDAEACNGDFAGNATLTGTVAPDQALSGLAGAAVNGDWTLSIDDGFGGDGGCVANFSVNVEYAVAAATAPVASDNCIDPTIANGGLTYTDNVTDGDCLAGDQFLQVIERTWTATDAKGHTASCVQIINIKYSTLADVAVPSNYDNIDQPALDCSGAGWTALANGNPSPVTTGQPTGVGCSNLAFEYEDLRFAICENSFKVRRRWTVLDWCSGDELEFDQIIKVLDETGPTIAPIADLDESTTTNSCLANVVLPTPALSDNCSSAGNISYTATASSGNLLPANGGYVLYGLAIGTHTVSYEATDDCGNKSDISFEITVTDGVAPVAICETYHVASLTTNEPTLIYANTFDDGSYDNCELESMEVRRMTSPVPCINFDWTTNGAGIDETPNGQTNNADRGTQSWYPAVPFACCDIGGSHLVEFRVTDAAGTHNTCMVTVEVEDKLDPIISCPASVTYECSEYYNVPSDLPLDGINQDEVGAPAYYVALNGPGNADNDTTFVGHYANAFDNCDVTVYIRDNGSINNCGIGSVNRFFTAIDGGGRTDVCVQGISVINSTPYTGPLSFPSDKTYTTCDDIPNSGTPNIGNDNTCSQVAVTHEDLELPVVDGSCYKILRTWHVIDWCSYNANTGAGYWTDVQIIKVVNSTAPEFADACADQEFCINSTANGDCLADVSLSVSATDDCTPEDELNYTYWVDYNNDGTPDQGGSTSSFFSSTVAIGTHSIKWTVEDGCGNISVCEYLFTVSDCDGPTAYAINGLAVDLGQAAEADVWASELDNGSYDLCSDVCELRIGVPSAGPGQTAPPTATHHVFTCDNLAQYGSNIPVDLWVKDCANNWSYVSTYVLLEDNSNTCNGNTPAAAISGLISTEMTESVEAVQVNVTGNAPGIPSAVYTNNGGTYGMPGLPLGYNYTVTPGLDLEPLNGVSTYDLVLISKHILNTQQLDSPYKRIAADVNNSGSITTFDMVELRKLILFIDTEFQNNTSWRFVESNFVFADATNPWAASFPELSNINGLTTNEIADYVGIKVGDVNSSAIPNSLVGGEDRTTVGDLVFQVEDQKMVAGEEYTVNFNAKDFNEVMGYQFTLSFDQDAVEFVNMTAGNLTQLNDANFGLNKVNEGVITTSWNNTEATALNNNEVVFSVTFKATASTMLSDVLNMSSRYTAAEAYNAELELMGVAIEYNSNNGVVAANGFDLYQNTPNPFKNETVIGFTLPEAGNASLKVYDVAGRVLKTVEGDFAKGYNEVSLNRSELSGTGVLYYTLESANDSATKKMIIVD